MTDKTFDPAAAIEAASQALTAAANLTEGATDDDGTCLKDEGACFRINPVHFAWYQLGETGVIGETKAIARVAVEAAHKPLLDALAAAREELAEAKREVWALNNSDDGRMVLLESELNRAKAGLGRAVDLMLRARHYGNLPASLREQIDAFTVEKDAAVPGDGEQAAEASTTREVTLAEATQHAIAVTVDAEQRRIALAEHEAARYDDCTCDLNLRQVCDTCQATALPTSRQA